MKRNCLSPYKCPFIKYAKEDGYFCELTKKNIYKLTDPIYCRPLIDYQMNHYVKR